MDYFNRLPVEITSDILSRVATESVLECKLVSSYWKGLIRHPSFSKIHLHRLNNPSNSAANDSGKMGFYASTFDFSSHTQKFHYFEYTDESAIQRIRRINFTSPFKYTRFVGSYNGLICLAQELSLCICNPVTKELVMLPEIKRNFSDIDPHWMASFGYVSSTDQYKVVGVYRSEFDADIDVYAYTLGSGNGWRNIGKFNHEFRVCSSFSGMFANGALYWMDRDLKRIITFDLAEEKFSENLSPSPLSQDSDWHNTRIEVLDGFLYIAVCRLDIEQRGDCFDVWLLTKKCVNHEMKENEEHHLSIWSKELRTDKSRLFAVTKNVSVLTYDDYYLNIYDTRTSTSKSFVKFKDWLLQVFPHRNTFVSLKELGEEDTETMESVEMEETIGLNYPFNQLQKDANLDYTYL